MAIPELPQKKPLEEIFNWQLDRSVEPYVLVEGVAGRDTGGTWRYLKVSSSGALTNDDAANFRVSALGVNITDVSNSDAADFRTSTIQGDAGLFRTSAILGEGSNFLGQVSAIIKNYPLTVSGTVSAFINQGTISALSPDAALFRVSGIGTFTTTGLSANQQISAVLLAGTANVGYVSAFIDNGSLSAKSSDAALFRVSTINSTSALSPDAALFRVSSIGGAGSNDILVDGTDNTISARIVQISAAVSSNLNAFVVRATNFDSATQFRVSAFVDSGSVSAKSSGADTFLVSAKQGDAGVFRVSAIIDNGSVSAKSSDAGLLRMSAIGGTAGDNTLVDGVDQTISARIKQISAVLSASDNALIVHIISEGAGRTQVSAKSDSANLFRVSAIQDGAANLNVSAKSDSANLFRVSAIVDNGSVSAKSSDGGTFRVSAIIDNGSVSAKSSDAGTMLVSGKSGDAGVFRVSAIIDNGSVSAKSSDAGTFLVSGKQGDASLLRISSLQGDAANQQTSAKSGDAALLRTSAIQGDANNQHVSAVQGDAGLMRVSSLWTTVGSGLTLFTSSFDTGSTGGVAVVNGAASKRIYIHTINLTLNAAGGVKWQSGATDLQGLNRLQASGGYMLATTPPAYVIATTSAGQDLNIGLSATGVSASGWVAGWSI